MTEICYGYVQVHAIPKKNPLSGGDFDNTIDYVLIIDSRPGPHQAEGTTLPHSPCQ